jgi:hypothetical protein
MKTGLCSLSDICRDHPLPKSLPTGQVHQQFDEADGLVGSREEDQRPDTTLGHAPSVQELPPGEPTSVRPM